MISFLHLKPYKTDTVLSYSTSEDTQGLELSLPSHTASKWQKLGFEFRKSSSKIRTVNHHTIVERKSTNGKWESEKVRKLR